MVVQNPFLAPAVCVILPPMSFLRLRKSTAVALLLGAIVFTILWKGGKSLESTWILPPLAFLWVWTQWRSAQEELVWKRPLLWSLIVSFLVWTFVSYLLSTTRNYGLDDVLRDASLFVLILQIARLADRKALADRLLRTVGWCALVAVGIGVCVYVLQPVNRFVGTFFDFRFQTDYWPNAWAQFVLLAWPAVLWMAVTASGRRRSFTIIALGLLVGGLLLSYSRGGMLAFGGQCVLLSLLLGLRSRLQVASSFPWRSAMAGVGITALTALLLFAVTNGIRAQFYEVESVVSKVTFTAAEGNSSITERSAFWRQAAVLATQRPVFGWGPGSFRFVQPHLQRGILATSDHPHNVFLKLAMERGMVASLLYFLILATILGVAFFMEWREAVGGRLTTRTVMIVSVCGVLAHNLIDYNLQFVGIILPLSAFLGVLAGEHWQHAQFDVPRRVQRGAEVLIAVLLCCITVLEGRTLVISSLGRHAEAAGNADDALRWYELSRGEWYSRDLFLSHAQLLMNQGKSAQAEQVLQRYMSENAQDFRAWKLLGQSLSMQKKLPAALDAFDRAYTWGREDDLSIVRHLIETLARMNDTTIITSKKQDIDALLGSYEQAFVQNTHYISLSPNVEEFHAVMSYLSTAFPQDAKTYAAMDENVRGHAEDAREKIKGRPPGFLW